MSAAKNYGPKDGGSYRDRAHERWENCPDWIDALAAAAENARSQTELGKRLGLASSTVSAVIGNTYPGNIDRIEARVRGVLMNARIQCPVMGEIARNRCIDFQELPFSGANPQRAQIWKACRAPCPHAFAANLAKGERTQRGERAQRKGASR
jgi:hypothetical protein